MPPGGPRRPAEWTAVSPIRSIAFALAVASLASACAPNFAAPVDAPRVIETPDEVVVTVPISTTPPRPDQAVDVAEPSIDEADVPVETVPVETLVAPSNAMPETVAVVGDSLTRSAETQIQMALAHGGLDVLTIDALESRRMVRGDRDLTSGADAIETILEGADPDLWVIALGTNDVASEESSDVFQPEMHELLALVPRDVPVVWVDLWIRDREPHIRKANEMIRDELRDWDGGAAVVDWYSYGDDDGIITADGVHLTARGRQVFAISIAATIDELFVP